MSQLTLAPASRLLQAPLARPAARRGCLTVRLSSREDELAKMAAFKSGLAAKLESSRRGSTAGAASAGAAETATAAPADAAAGKSLREVTKEDYYSVIRDAGSKLVVVDCYTEWCGPCKMILPTLQQWAEELEGRVEIVKFNCNKHNKELGVALGIKVAPTFLLYKGGQQVDKMTGAKAEQLRELIDKHV